MQKRTIKNFVNKLRQILTLSVLRFPEIN